MNIPMLVYVDVRYPGIWPKLSPYIERALSEGECLDWSADDVREAALSGRVTIWAGVCGQRVVGAAALCVVPYPNRTVLDVLAIGTEPNSDIPWDSFLPDLKDIAKRHKATAITGRGRKGWARALDAKPIYGFEVII